ncbi:hypothetical protein AOC03_08680 [Psychrobacter urativorans]|uniref:Uncharacterized protein n=1 Tax=Psychrobacter urativorans TaxID=45610 RepID=A0A0M4U7E5_9GAMM|nr:hypothetical protein AOC03_08680 [Psychrobacter urativorans]
MPYFLGAGLYLETERTSGFLNITFKRELDFIITKVLVWLKDYYYQEALLILNCEKLWKKTVMKIILKYKYISIEIFLYLKGLLHLNEF